MALEHPFILRLHASYQDAQKLYMLLEIVPGGELFGLQGEQPDARFQPDWARFYAACVEASLAYMHNLNILYRDLKPENLLIDREGFIKVVDFGFAKEIAVGDRTFTLCGTPGECSFMYRYILRESCSQFDSLPLTSLLQITSRRSCCSARATAKESTFGRSAFSSTRCSAGTRRSRQTIRTR